MFVFPANNAGYRNRKKAFRACEQCKRGRRRCLPSQSDQKCGPCLELGINCSFLSSPPKLATEDDILSGKSREELVALQEKLTSLIGDGGRKRPRLDRSNTYPSTPDQINNGDNNGNQKDSQSPLAKSSTSTSGGLDANSADVKFISRMDPSSDLIMMGDPDRDRVGIWVSSTAAEESTRRHDNFRRRIEIPCTLDRHVLAHLNSLRAFEFPAQKDTLIDIFFDHFEPVFPIVDKEAFMETYRQGDFSVPLLHAMLLVSCRHKRAKPLLDGLDARTFAVRCYQRVNALLYSGIESNQIVLSRIYALLFFHSEGPEGLPQSSGHLFTALHKAFSLGLHLRRSSNENRAQLDSTLRLWWTLWAMDKMNSCVNGLPVMIHQEDIGVDDVSECPGASTCFQGLVTGCYQLSRIIELYRPIKGKCATDFEFAPIPPDDSTPYTAFVRLTHLMAGILGRKRIEKMTPELLEMCLDVCTIVETYDDIVQTTFVPYAVSVTLTVFARMFNHPVARNNWKRAIAILDTLAGEWWVAEAMSSMGRKVFEKLESESEATDVTKASTDLTSDLVLDGTVSSFFGQTSILLGDMDRDSIDTWFPDGFPNDLNFFFDSVS